MNTSTRSEARYAMGVRDGLAWKLGQEPISDEQMNDPEVMEAWAITIRDETEARATDAGASVAAVRLLGQIAMDLLPDMGTDPHLQFAREFTLVVPAGPAHPRLEVTFVYEASFSQWFSMNHNSYERDMIENDEFGSHLAALIASVTS